jgi:hypothetical protein
VNALARARRVPAGLAAVALAACSSEGSRSPTCGLAQIAGPALIQQQLVNVPYVLTEAPRGLPSSLPGRVIGVPQQGVVRVTYTASGLVMEYQGPSFPPAGVGYGLLVVDDSTQRAQGVLIYESQRPPKTYPQLGEISGGDGGAPLYGVRVDWAGVNNPRCPLLGAAAPPER